MQATLYVIPGSHPSMAGRLMLEHKGIPYKRRDLLPIIAKPVLRGLRFPTHTVPAIVLDGRRIQGTRVLSRALEEIKPDPPLFPADPALRAAVEEAERWGEEVLQPMPRRVSWWALRRDRNALRSFSEGARLGVPVGLVVRTSAPIVLAEIRMNHADDEHVRTDLAGLPALLDQVDRYIADGTIGGGKPNAADFQIATSVRLIMCAEDLTPYVEGRPAAALARRIVPVFPGRLAAGAFPADWLSPR
jgi:glutathione S-transferase